MSPIGCWWSCRLLFMVIMTISLTCIFLSARFLSYEEVGPIPIYVIADLRTSMGLVLVNGDIFQIIHACVLAYPLRRLGTVGKIMD
ncbi:uncharacterized protein EV420DRAFT_1555769 [Desarmillaria tabescens]|uniref:Uncharacterized protein n=1 Tax=Armillaria tabescens TaxID=1929756 RepID=A0AA39K4I4_ARMTA|nr:uncharacterized protein EV420DRAFT_1555769 [Desarmillaria tabescens]KAK0454212.1 hypothetical protein EV420DRAFT_1555769 [Desarmillaria tabescens]